LAHGPLTDLPMLRQGKPWPIERWLGPLQRFARLEASGGIVILTAAVVALAWANSPAGALYDELRHAAIGIRIESFEFTLSAEHWINDALMAVFFFLVGLEIKREILVGALSTWKQAALPVFGAVGGMLVPGLIYAGVNWGHPETIRGWGVPMATDIAFALGVLSLGARGAPRSLRVFLATLAVADDLGALLVIAIFYTERLDLGAMAWGGIVLGGMFALGASGARRGWPFALLAAVLWGLVHRSGVHATIAGVLAAVAIPARERVDGRAFVEFSRDALDRFEHAGPGGHRILSDPRRHAIVRGIGDACDKARTPLQLIEHALAAWVAFAIVPLFALANAGVAVAAGDMVGTFLSRECLGVVLGLTLGKPIGITLAAWFAVRLGLGQVPAGVSWMQLHGAAWLAGIGFTMSLFIANLAFANGPALLDHAKVGILLGSLVSGIVGLIILRRARPRATHSMPARTP
jgi:Na+:H+ antiporter, NhaA family